MGKLWKIPAAVVISVAALLATLVWSHVSDKSTEATVLYENAVQSVVIIECTHEGIVGTTAGFVASSYGHIITVAHGVEECVGKEQNIGVRFWQDPSRIHRAQVVLFDSDKDVAILQVPTTPSETPLLGVDFGYQPTGSRIISIGHPEAYYWSVGEGVVSADRLYRHPLLHIIQVSTPINPGNSGGPIVNSQGNVIGIVSYNLGGNPTLGFIVPMDTVLSLLRKAKGIYF